MCSQGTFPKFTNWIEQNIKYKTEETIAERFAAATFIPVTYSQVFLNYPISTYLNTIRLEIMP